MATCKDCIHYDVCHYHIDEETDMTITECGGFINKAYFVVVVRCRDCKHCQKVQDEWDNDWYFCLNSANNKSVEATDFCNYGERRDT